MGGFSRILKVAVDRVSSHQSADIFLSPTVYQDKAMHFSFTPRSVPKAAVGTEKGGKAKKFLARPCKQANKTKQHPIQLTYWPGLTYKQPKRGRVFCGALQSFCNPPPHVH